MAVETVLSTVSETRSCAAHRFYCGLQQLWNRASIHPLGRNQTDEIRISNGISLLFIQNDKLQTTKKKDRENNLVEAAQRLFSKLHDQIEPPVSK